MGTSKESLLDNGVPNLGLARPRIGHSRNISTPNLHFSGSRSSKRQTWNELNRTSSSAALTAASLAAKACSANLGEPRSKSRSVRRGNLSSYRYGQTVQKAVSIADNHHEYQNKAIGSQEIQNKDQGIPQEKENICTPEIIYEGAVESTSDSIDSSDSSDENLEANEENIGNRMGMLAISSDGLASGSSQGSQSSTVKPDHFRRSSSLLLRSRRRPPPLESTVSSISRAEKSVEARRKPLLTLRGMEIPSSPSPYGYESHNASSQPLLTTSDEDSEEESDMSSKMDVPNYTIISGMILEDPVYKHHHHHHTTGLSRMLGLQKNSSQDSLKDEIGRSSHERAGLSAYSLESGQSRIEDGKQRQHVFRTTLRDKKPSKRHRKSRLKEFDERKPWKHHKASSYVSEDEKESYSLVWKVNKNAYLNEYKLLNESRPRPESLPMQDYSKYLPKDRIVGIVVREIWKRSRLSDEMLAQIWDLILTHRYKMLRPRFELETNDSSTSDASIFDDGTLTETEFLVGMWMVDQCLYGRKLPKEIEPSVWDSVESTGAFDARRLRHHMRKVMMSKVVGKI